MSSAPTRSRTARTSVGFAWQPVSTASYPLCAEVPGDLAPADRAAWIYRANLVAIRSCDIVMANIADFRGVGEPDSGTAFEIGFATALGKDVWAYTPNETTLAERVAREPCAQGLLCENGFLVEDFGLAVNLMIACAARVVIGGPERCLAAMAEHYRPGSTPSCYRPAGESEIRSVGA